MKVVPTVFAKRVQRGRVATCFMEHVLIRFNCGLVLKAEEIGTHRVVEIDLSVYVVVAELVVFQMILVRFLLQTNVLHRVELVMILLRAIVLTVKI
jgi:hypothetical protein